MFELLGLNKLDYVGRKVDKKMFYENADLSKNEKKIFIDYISRVEIAYIINNKNLNVDAFVNEEYRYEAIIYLNVNLKIDDKLDKISKIINNAIPNPLVLIFKSDEKYKISTAIKRLSKNENNKTVMEEVRTSSWIDINNLNDNEKNFLNSISIYKLPYNNLFDFYKVMNDKIYVFEKTVEIGEYKDISDKKKLEEIKEVSEKIESLEVKLKKTVSKLKKESQFAKKMELNVKATQLKKEIDELKNILM